MAQQAIVISIKAVAYTSSISIRIYISLNNIHTNPVKWARKEWGSMHGDRVALPTLVSRSQTAFSW